MITLTSLKPFEDMDIVFTGLRPGEKLYEELAFFGEGIAKPRHPKIFIGNIGSYSSDRVEDALSRLAHLATTGDGDSIRVFLNELLPEAKLGVRRESQETRLREDLRETGKASPVA